jgi:predicted ATPase
MKVQKKIIAIIGGPGSGKSSIIKGLETKGYCCYPEISREITHEAKKRGIEQLFLEDPLLFSQMLLDGRIKQFYNAKNEPHQWVFIDRGIPDVVAYLNYIGDGFPAHFDTACRENVYDKIFILPPWERIYESDNERYESFEQAKTIHKHLTKTYNEYGYNLIEVPKDSVDNRIIFILDKI